MKIARTMDIARWFQQKSDELQRDPFAPGVLLKSRCLLVLSVIYQCFLCDLRNYYAFKAWFFRSKAACLYAYADALEAWGRSRRLAKIRRWLKSRSAHSGKGAQRG